MNADGTATVASASTVEADIKSTLKGTGNAEAAVAVGSAIAKRALEAGVSQVALIVQVLNIMVV
jgi:large subunit ribosomal protein L18